MRLRVSEYECPSEDELVGVRMGGSYGLLRWSIDRQVNKCIGSIRNDTINGM